MPRQAAPLIVFAVHECGDGVYVLRELWSARSVYSLCASGSLGGEINRASGL